MGCNHSVKSLPLSYPQASTKGRGGSGHSRQWLRCRRMVPDITTRHRGFPSHVLAAATGRETLGTKECHVLDRKGGECFIIVTMCPQGQPVVDLAQPSINHESTNCQMLNVKHQTLQLDYNLYVTLLKLLTGDYYFPQHSGLAQFAQPKGCSKVPHLGRKRVR